MIVQSFRDFLESLGFKSSNYVSSYGLRSFDVNIQPYGMEQSRASYVGSKELDRHGAKRARQVIASIVAGQVAT